MSYDFFLTTFCIIKIENLNRIAGSSRCLKLIIKSTHQLNPSIKSVQRDHELRPLSYT